MKTCVHTLLATLLLAAAVSSADITEEGRGVVWGSDHAFSLTAPKGWMVDTESGVKQGVHALFYPKGSTWKESLVFAYARARPKTAEIATADDAAQFVVDDFHTNGNPKYGGKRIKTIKTASGRDVVIYHFSGDQWGNSEAAAYYVEVKTINFVTLTCRNQKAFEDALPAFEQLAMSYIFIGDTPLPDGKPQPTVDATKADKSAE